MLLQNEYTKLKKVNDLSAETLSPDNRKALKEISGCLLCLTWNCYEIERVRKDMIAMAARCELEGRTLREEVGGDTARFVMELDLELPRGTPLDYVCIWYPKWLFWIAAIFLVSALMDGSTPLNLFRVLSGPVQFMFWLVICAWLQRTGLKIRIRYGCAAQLLWYLLLILVSILSCFVVPVFILQEIPGTISYLGAFFYELAWAVGCKAWQNAYYNRWAACHPWQGVA